MACAFHVPDLVIRRECVLTKLALKPLLFLQVAAGLSLLILDVQIRLSDKIVGHNDGKVSRSCGSCCIELNT